MKSYLVLFGLVAAGVLLVFLAKIITQIKDGSQKEEEKLPFKLKDNFFTRSEWEFFRILEEKIDHSRFTIFPKVRLGDFIETTAQGDEWRGNWNKIRAKHVDFLIYDTQNSSIAIAIELDGNSHNSQRMQKSDDFKNKVYPAIGLELVRVRVGTDFATEIRDILSRL
jgi:very-short-patch-repair endonuclease